MEDLVVCHHEPPDRPPKPEPAISLINIISYLTVITLGVGRGGFKQVLFGWAAGWHRTGPDVRGKSEPRDFPSPGCPPQSLDSGLPEPFRTPPRRSAHRVLALQNTPPPPLPSLKGASSKPRTPNPEYHQTKPYEYYPINLNSNVRVCYIPCRQALGPWAVPPPRLSRQSWVWGLVFRFRVSGFG